MRRSTLAVAIGAVTLGIVLLYAQTALPLAVWHLLVDGSVLVLWLLSAGGIGAGVLRLGKFKFGKAHPALRVATVIGLGMGIMSLIALGLGLAGALDRIAAIAMIGVGIVAGMPTWVAILRRSAQILNERAGWNWLLVLCAPFLAIMITGDLIAPGLLWGPDDPAGYDVVEYHLQVPREWFEAGRIIPLQHNVFSYFPFNVEMHYLLAMHLRGGPWVGMFLAQFMHAAMMGVMLVAIYGTARATAGRALACIATLAAASAPWTILLGAVAYDEGGMLLFGTLSIAWTVYWMASAAKSYRTIAMAGVFAGLACGSKLTAVPAVLVAVPVTMVAVMFFRKEVARVRGCAVFVLAGLLAFSPWLIRNQVWAGNPVFPEGMSVLGRGHFSEIQEQRWHQAHSPRSDQRAVSARFVALWQQIGGDWRFGFLLLPLGVLAAGLSIRSAAAKFLFLLGLFFTLFWLSATHLQSRFFVLAIPLVALSIAQVRHARWALIAGGVLAIAAVPAFLNLHTRMMQFTRGIGLEGIETHDSPLVLVGDAKAFWYQSPHLHYRTVFDVDNSIELGIVQDWIGNVPITRDTVIEVDAQELGRFSRTYFGIPAPPPEIRDQQRPFRIDPASH